MTAVLSVPNMKSVNACKWINRKGKKYILKNNARKQLEILVTIIPENLFSYILVSHII